MGHEELRREFERLTGYRPLPWQRRLYQEFFARNEIPAGVDVPTGLGKTAVIALWLIAIRSKSKLLLPRRLVYVVDRRAVVDQATAFVEEIRKRLPDKERFPISTLRGKFADNREWLDDPSRPAVIVGTVDMIGSRLLFEGYGVSRKMRPYHAGLLGADSLIVLDEAHLVPPFERLLESIETNSDTLAVEDEKSRISIPKLRLLSLSATGRERKGKIFRLGEQDLDDNGSTTQRRLNAVKGITIGLIDAKSLPEQLASAAWALTNSGTQPLRCLVYCNSRDQAEKTLLELNKRQKQRAQDSVDLPSIETELFIGARRGYEREAAEIRLKELGFIAGGSQPDNRIRFLIATSAGEVGIDLDADHMVCDLVAIERMIQRLGRVNRRGDRNAQVRIIAVPPTKPNTSEPSTPDTQVPDEPASPVKPDEKLDQAGKQAFQAANKKYRTALKSFQAAKKKHDAEWKKYAEKLAKYDEAMQETRTFEARLQAVELLSGDGSPAAIQALMERARHDEVVSRLLNKARSEAPLRPALTRPLLDAWAMTSLKEHTGRPEVAPWLRGWVEDEPQTTVVWRKYMPTEQATEDKHKSEHKWRTDVEAYFEAAPTHISEQLQTETYRVADWLVTRAKRLIKQIDTQNKRLTEDRLDPTDAVAISLSNAGDYSNHFELAELANADKKRLQRSLAGKTLIVKDIICGLSETGTLDPAFDDEPSWLGDFDEGWEPAAREPSQRTIQWRVAYLSGDEEPVLEASWHSRSEFVIKRDAAGEITFRLVVYKWKQDAANEEDRAIGKSQSLVDHHNQAAKRATEISRRLNLPEDYTALLTIAARLHDEGKKAERWQSAFNAPSKDRPFAKTEGPVNTHLLDGYRHEFGSLFYAEQDNEFQSLSPDKQDLVLHLIAAHHGNARPTISIRSCDHAPPSVLETHAQDVALRFVRLQRRWGPWGLAWWESLLRAADQQASRDNK